MMIFYDHQLLTSELVGCIQTLSIIKNLDI